MGSCVGTVAGEATARSHHGWGGVKEAAKEAAEALSKVQCLLGSSGFSCPLRGGLLLLVQGFLPSRDWEAVLLCGGEGRLHD